MGTKAGIKSGLTPFMSGNVVDAGGNQGIGKNKIGPLEIGEAFYNSTGGALAAGDVVYKLASAGIDATYGVKVAKADPTTSGKPSLYVVAEATAASTRGLMVSRGLLKTSLDASGGAVGDPVYWTGSALSLSNATNLPVVGLVTTATTNAFVNFDTAAYSAASSGQSFTFVQAVASANITNTTTETVFTQGVTTIPAGMIALGRPLKVKFQGQTPTTNGADTLTLKLILGGTTTNATGAALMTLPPLDVADSDMFSGEFTLVARAAPSATTSCVGFGTFTFGTPGTATTKSSMFGPTNLATSNALPIKISATWSAASANDIVRLDNFIVSVTPDPV